MVSTQQESLKIKRASLAAYHFVMAGGGGGKLKSEVVPPSPFS